MTAEKTYRSFFKTHDNLDNNRRQLRFLLKPTSFATFDNETKRVLEKSNVLRWVVDKIPFLRNIERFPTEVVHCQKVTLHVHKLGEAAVTILSEVPKLEMKFKAEYVSGSENQSSCNQLVQIV